DGGQDEQRLEHDGEVVPVRHEVREEGDAGEDLGEADGQRNRAAGTAGQALPDQLRELLQVDGAHTEFGEHRGGDVDGVVVALLQRADGDEGDAAHQPFAEH